MLDLVTFNNLILHEKGFALKIFFWSLEFAIDGNSLVWSYQTQT